MAALFSKPKTPSMPTPEPVPPTPTLDEAREAQSAEDELRKKRGRAANLIMSQDAASVGAYDVGTKTLLGA